MTTKIHADTGIEFPDATVQSSAAYSKAESDGPAFSAYNSNGTLQTVVGWQVLPLVTELFDTANAYDAPNVRFQPTVAGYYQISISSNVAVGTRIIVGFQKNSTIRYQGSDVSDSAAFASVCSALVYLNGNTDYITPQIYTAAISIVGAGEGVSYITGFLARRA